MPNIVDEIISAKTSQFTSTTFQVMLLNDARSVYTFTADSGTDVITTSATHDYITDTPVIVSQSGGALPSPLNNTDIYYARDISSSTLKLAATRGGAVIDLANNGSGTLTIADVSLDIYTAKTKVVEAVRKELTSTTYRGLTVRPTWTPPAPTSLLNVISVASFITLDNSAGAAALVFNKIVVLRGGTTAISNTTGNIVSFKNFTVPISVAAGQSLSLSILDEETINLS